MKTLIKSLIYKANRRSREEILEELARIRELNSALLTKLEQANNQSLEDIKNTLNHNGVYEVLPGTEYSRYAIPLDYQPSRDLTPRWGFSKPVITELEEWFQKHDDEYMEILDFMKQLRLDHIPCTISDRSHAAWTGGAITPFDAVSLYAMVMKNKPRHYVEIGSGMTTCFARQAVIDGNLETKIISIDPQPRMEIESICDDVFRDGLERFDVNRLNFLEPGDILFLDGSHRTFMNSDVTVFFIDILPKLKPGVIVHLHDIPLPYDYDEMFKNWYWNEQYMLAVCFLNGMDKINPLLPVTYICRNKKFEKYFKVPFVDLGAENNVGWRYGGSMWFCYK